MRSFDEVTFTSEDDGGTRRVTVSFLRWTEQEDLDSTMDLVVEFRRQGPQIVGVASAQLIATSDVLDIGEISRFPWNRWLRVARLHAEAETALVRGEASDKWLTTEEKAPDTPRGRRANLATEAAKRASGAIGAAPRPGRHGHGQDFYKEVADRWRELVLSGDKAPARTIATERNFSVNTVNGWLRRARQIGLSVPSMRASKGAEK